MHVAAELEGEPHLQWPMTSANAQRLAATEAGPEHLRFCCIAQEHCCLTSPESYDALLSFDRSVVIGLPCRHTLNGASRRSAMAM